MKKIDNEKNQSIAQKFLSMEISARIASLGFDEECFAYYEIPEERLFVFYSNLPVDKDEEGNKPLEAGKISNSTLPDWAVAAPLIQDAEDWLFDRFKLFAENFMDDDGTFGYLISKPFDEQGAKGRINYPIVRELKTSTESRIKCISNMIDIALSENSVKDQEKPITEIMRKLNLLDSERPVDSTLQSDELHKIIAEEANRKSSNKNK